MNTLHVYAQSQWHDDAFVAGDRKSLEDLRSAIDRALAHGDGRAKATSFTNDGEGFDVHVLLLDDKTMDRLALPYTDEIASEKKDAALWPASLLRVT